MMDATQEQEVARLLSEGLDSYGRDEVDAAIAAWQRVLEIDPHNADAEDYVESAGRRPAAEPKPARADESGSTLLEEVLGLAAAGRLEDAWAMLEGATTGQPLAAVTSAVMDLVRSLMVPHYRARLGPDVVPRAAKDHAAIEGFDLPPGAGFLVSLCDGATPIPDLIALSGTDAFETLHTLNRLAQAGLVSVDE